MPRNEDATPKQCQFMVDLWQGAIQQGKVSLLPDALQVAGNPDTYFVQRRSRGEVSEIIDHLLWKARAVRAGREVKPATDGQITMWHDLCARTSDLTWRQHDITGITSWTLSMWIRSLEEHLEREAVRQGQQNQQYAQGGGQQPQPQWPTQQQPQPQQQYQQQPQYQQQSQPQFAPPIDDDSLTFE